MTDLPSWGAAKRVAVDVETCDPDLKKTGPGVRRNGYMVGVSFSIEDGPSHYLPFAHAGGDNLDKEQIFSYLRRNMLDFKGEVVGANLMYDLDFLEFQKLKFNSNVRYRDVQIAEPLINELHNSYSLENICIRHGLPGKDETLLRQAALEYKFDPKSDLWKLPARFVGPYAIGDTERPLAVLRRQERILDDKDLWGIWDIESRVLPALLKLRQRGVLIDQDQLGYMSDWSKKQEGEFLNQVHAQTGVRIKVGDVWKVNALLPVFEYLGIQLPKTKTGKPSIKKEVLEQFDHPAVAALTQARKFNKIRTTFVKSIIEHMVNGRIHCTFNQMRREDDDGDMAGARFGRISAGDPNMQQQPSPDKDPLIAGEWRKIFIPEPGCVWFCNDYSQQEPRWTTHYAALAGLPGASEAANAYWDNPLIDNHQFMADITKQPRKFAKEIFLGRCYGMGGASLARKCGLPTRWCLKIGRGRQARKYYYDTQEAALKGRQEAEDGYIWETAGKEAQEIINKFDERAPYIRLLAKEAESRAYRRGWVKTAGGRKLNFPLKKNGSFDWTHKALNRIIQGSSADQTKYALVVLHESFPEIFVQMQVHDEIDGSAETMVQVNKVAEVMRTCMDDIVTNGVKVPFRVDEEVGPNWSEIGAIAA